MNATRTAIATAVVLAAVLSQAACSRDHRAARKGGLPPDEATALLDERIWLDKEPRTPREVFHLMVFEGDASMGIYQDRTIWKGSFEMFKYEAQSGRLDLILPGSNKRVKTGFTVERVNRGQADVKLTLEKAPLGPTVYYGYDFGGGDVDAWLAAHFPASTH